MLSDRERSALEQWYSQEKVLAEARRLYDIKADEDLEEYLQMVCLFPLSRHAELPAFMKDDKDEPLFPTNLNPAKDLEKWRDAIEVGWEVMERELGFSRDEIHRRIGEFQKSDWKEFMESAKRRKQEREAKDED
jgi:hypothetical protein